MTDDMKEMLYKVGGMGDPKGRYPRIEEDDDIQVYKKPWVNLSETQIQNIYYKVVDEHRGAPMPWGQVVFAQAVQAALKELNT